MLTLYNSLGGGGYTKSFHGVNVPLFVRKVTSIRNPCISNKYKDNYTKRSGYYHGGLPCTFMMLWMTLSSKAPVRNPQRPPSTPMKDKGFLTHF